MGDESAVEGPPDGFRAQHRHPPLASEVDKLGQAAPEFVGHRVVRIIVQALILPPTVDFRRHVGGLAPKAAPVLDPGLADLAGGKPLRPRAAILFRLASRTWKEPDNAH